MPESPQTLTCSQCGATSPEGQRFCGTCGAALPAPVAAVPEGAATKPAIAPESARSSDAKRTIERDRLLTLVNVQRVRGQLPDALKSLDEALVLSEGRSDRELAPIHELRGDLLKSQNQWEAAQASYEKAFALDGERAGAEKKFAEATLRIAEAKAIASGSMLGLGGDGFADSFAHRPPTKPGVALVASFFVPGFGQLVNGQIVKAGICLGVFLLTMLALYLSPDAAVLFAKMRAIVAPTDARAQSLAREPLSPLLTGLLFLLAVTWVYSLVDAASGAAKANTANGTAPPAGDRSGWEV